MSDAAWLPTVPESDLVEGKPVVAKAGEKEVLLVRSGGTPYAVAHECPHYHAPLSKGTLTPAGGGHPPCVTCPAHLARFDLATGAVLAPPSLDDLARYDVRVRDGTLEIAATTRPQPGAPAAGDARVFVILGAGAAGAAAAETLRREGFGGRVVMVTREADRPYDRPNLSKELLAGTAKPEWMPLRSGKFYAARRIELVTGRTAIGLEVAAGARALLLDGGERLGFDKLLLATGAEPRALTVPGADLPGSFRLRSWQDARELIAALDGARRVVVAGASFLGLEVASSLRARGLEVHVASPEALPRARVFGDRVAGRIRALHEQGGVVFHLGATIREISGSGRAERVALSDGGSLAADLVVAGVGVVPSVGYLAGTGLVADGGVPVGADFQTRVPGIYAAGDIAVFAGARIEHWAVAQSQGQHAARAMLDRAAPWAEAPFFWTRQFEKSFCWVGRAVPPEATLYRGDVEGGTFTAGYFAGGRLVAAAALGGARELTRIRELLTGGEPISAEVFEKASFL